MLLCPPARNHAHPAPYYCLRPTQLEFATAAKRITNRVEVNTLPHDPAAVAAALVARQARQIEELKRQLLESRWLG